MGVDTKGFVTTSFKNVMLVAELLERSLDRLIRAEKCRLEGVNARAFSPKYQMVNIRLRPSSDGLNLVFKLNGEERSMSVFFSCDCDHKDTAPASLSLSLGAWGHSVLLVKQALYALSVLGPTYINENDATSVGYIPLGLPRLTVKDAMGLQFIPMHRLAEWIAAWDRGEFASAMLSFDEFFGMPEDSIRNLVQNKVTGESYTPNPEQLACFIEELREIKEHAETAPPAFIEAHHAATADLATSPARPAPEQ